MSNIQKSNSLPASLTEAISMGKAMFESGLFTDLKSAAQAVVKIQAGAEIGIPPFAALTGIHIIQGKPSIGAGLMAARVKGSGKYDYRVTQNDEKACSIDFYQGPDKIGNSTFTIEDAKKAQTKNIDKHPKNMLFARAMSNGVKWFTPDVFAGPVYVPEEISEIVTEDVPHEVLPQKKPAQNKDITAIEKRLRADGSDLTAIMDKATAAFSFDDQQAEYLTGVVNEVYSERISKRVKDLEVRP